MNIRHFPVDLRPCWSDRAKRWNPAGRSAGRRPASFGWSGVLLATMLSAILVFGSTVPAHAGIWGETAKKMGFNDHEATAIEAFVNAAAAHATKGESVRGASGAMGEILVNSGELTCSALVISFIPKLRKLREDYVKAKGTEQEIEAAARLRQAEELLAKLDAAREMFAPGAGEAVPPEGEGEQPPSEAPSDKAWDPLYRPVGWTADDEVCYRHCWGDHGKYVSAIADFRIKLKEAMEAQSRLASVSANMKTELEAANRELGQARGALRAVMNRRGEKGVRRTSGFSPTYRGVKATAPVGSESYQAQWLTDFQQAVDRFRAAQGKAKRLGQEATESMRAAEERLQRLAGEAAELLEAAQKAWRAFEECLERCASNLRQTGLYPRIGDPLERVREHFDFDRTRRGLRTARDVFDRNLRGRHTSAPPTTPAAPPPTTPAPAETPHPPCGG